jgi:hypothetical protein
MSIVGGDELLSLAAILHLTFGGCKPDHLQE